MREVRHQGEVMQGRDLGGPRGCCRLLWRGPGGFHHAALQVLLGKGVMAGQRGRAAEAGQAAGDDRGQTPPCSRGETRDLRALRGCQAAPKRERPGEAGGRAEREAFKWL